MSRASVCQTEPGTLLASTSPPPSGVVATTSKVGSSIVSARAFVVAIDSSADEEANRALVAPRKRRFGLTVASAHQTLLAAPLRSRPRNVPTRLARSTSVLSELARGRPADRRDLPVAPLSKSSRTNRREARRPGDRSRLVDEQRFRSVRFQNPRSLVRVEEERGGRQSVGREACLGENGHAGKMTRRNTASGINDVVARIVGRPEVLVVARRGQATCHVGNPEAFLRQARIADERAPMRAVRSSTYRAQYVGIEKRIDDACPHKRRGDAVGC